ncbi:hypothetical protein AYL99_02003 [Fonsecaea erecta]|uniref:Haloacid dehalogenase-like hydrolase n=1 Tax=Fonsecaea erecta TaxID=1367422 RepID=A0A178ZTI7_9EURO|nr:hypothetical protein AYL99_02003 [Fonsecaea erecta]OAP62776.1 hypothetical protein AYL99_02003 [Fonsecaea erecta]
MKQQQKPLRIVLDWDGTLTRRDTLHVLAAIGYSTRNNNRHRRSLTPWDQIVQAYMSDYKQHRDSYRPARPERRTVAQESAWLASLKDVELRSLQRVQDAGIFSDVTKQDIWTAAEDAVRDNEVELREGWKDLLSLASHATNETAEVARPPVPVSILSVNWSAAFIRACLSAALADDNSPLKGTVDSISILANRLACEVERPGDDGLDFVSIRTSADKLDALARLRRDGGTGDILYVGDSSTDFDCIVAADVGVCMRDEPMGSGQSELKETLERVGVAVLRLDFDRWAKYSKSIPGQGGSMESNQSVVWWVTHLREVASFVERYNAVD